MTIHDQVQESSKNLNSKIRKQVQASVTVSQKVEEEFKKTFLHYETEAEQLLRTRELQKKNWFLSDVSIFEYHTSPQEQDHKGFHWHSLWPTIIAIFLVVLQVVVAECDKLLDVRSIEHDILQYVAFWMIAIFALVWMAWHYQWDMGRSHRLRHSAMRRVFPFVLAGTSHGLIAYFWLAKEFCGFVPEMPGFGSGMAIVGFTFGFVLVARLNVSLTRWWEAKGAFSDFLQQAESMITLLGGFLHELSRTCNVEERNKLQDFHLGFTAMWQVMLLTMAQLHRLESGSKWAWNHRAAVADCEAQTWLIKRLEKREPPESHPLMWASSKINMALREMQEMIEFLQRCQACSTIKPTTFGALRGHLTGMVGAHYRCKKIARSRVPSAYRFIVWMAATVYAIVLLPRYLPHAFVVKVDPNSVTKAGLGGCAVLYSPMVISSFILSLFCAEVVIFGVLALSEGLGNPFGCGPYDLPCEAEIDEMFCRLRTDIEELQASLTMGSSFKEPRWWSRAYKKQAGRAMKDKTHENGQQDEGEDEDADNGDAEGNDDGVDGGGEDGGGGGEGEGIDGAGVWSV